MSSFLKYMLAAVLTIVGLFAAALAFVAFTFDPNDYKPQITASVDEATGRELTVDGDINLTLFPWLGARAQGVRLENAADFSPESMVSIDAVEVRLRLWPLLSGRAEIGQVIVDGLTVSLERREDGATNWADFVDSEAAQDEPGPEVKHDGSVPDFAVAGVSVRNAHLVWTDAGAVTELTNANLEIGALAPISAPDVRAEWKVRLPDGLQVDGQLSAQLLADLARRKFELRGLELATRATGASIPNGEQTVELRADAHVDATAFTADVPSLELTLAGQRISGQLQASGLDTGGHANIQINAPTLRFAQIARALAVELPPHLPVDAWPAGGLRLSAELDLAVPALSAANVLFSMGDLAVSANTAIADLSAPSGKADVSIKPLDLHAWLAGLGFQLAGGPGGGTTAVDMTVAYSMDEVRVADLRGTLDGAPLQANAAISDFSNPRVRADATLASLTVDRWMIAAQDAEVAPEGQEGAPPLDEMELPMDWARDLNLTARAEIKEMKAFGLTTRNVVWSADARPGEPVRQQLAARAYGGQFQASNTIDAREDTPKFSVDLSAAAVAIGDLLKAGWGGRWITGTTQASLGLSGSGKKVGALKSTAGGKAEYRVRDGQVFGVDLVHLIRSASARVQQQAAPETDDGDATSFSELAGRMTIENGRVSFRELGGRNPYLKLGGDGDVDLFGGAWNLNLLPQLVDSDTTRNDKWLKKLLGRTIPVSVTGPLLQPQVKVDIDSLVKQELKAQEQKLRDKADEKIEEKKDELREKAKDKLGDFLRKL